jgi:hypothetical protein
MGFAAGVVVMTESRSGLSATSVIGDQLEIVGRPDADEVH